MADPRREDSDEARSKWPEGFFDNSRFSAEELDELREAGEEMEREIFAARKNRTEEPCDDSTDD